MDLKKPTPKLEKNLNKSQSKSAEKSLFQEMPKLKKETIKEIKSTLSKNFS